MNFLKNCWSFLIRKGLTKRLTFTRFSEDHTLNSAEERVSWRSPDGVETQDGLQKNNSWMNMNQAYKGNRHLETEAIFHSILILGLEGHFCPSDPIWRNRFFFKHIWFTFWFHVHFPECKWFQPIFSPPPRCESLRRVPFWHLDLWALIRSVANFPWENTGNQKVDWFPHEKPKKNKAGDFWWGKPTTRLIILLGDLNFCCF